MNEGEKLADNAMKLECNSPQFRLANQIFHYTFRKGDLDSCFSDVGTLACCTDTQNFVVYVALCRLGRDYV